MASPRSLVHALYVHWDIIESLVPLSRDFPSFDPEHVLAAIGRVRPTLDVSQREDMRRQLINSDLLRVLPRGNALELDPHVLEFVRGLTREHELGLSQVLRARIEAIKDATAQLADALEVNQADGMRNAAGKLAELFRQISQQLDQDRHAILELAERARASDANLPLARRYAEVLEAYDSYVEPMAQMMDSGPGGTFYRHLEQAEQALDHAVETLEVRGALYSHRLSMRHVAFRAKELRRLGREVLKQCSDTLLPLREEVRKHNALSAAISQLLGQIRKRGLRRTLPSSRLPVWQRDARRRITVGDEVLTVMSEALNYTPPVVSFPEDNGEDDRIAVDIIDEHALLAALRRDAPVENLLDWLDRHEPAWSDATKLRLYHELVQREDWQSSQAEHPSSLALTQVRVTLYPHRITLPVETP